MDRDAARALALKTWQYKQGELVSLMIHLGRRLGLYDSLDRLGATSAEGVAADAGLDARWVREWLDGQAAAGLIERSNRGEYAMSAEQRAVLVDTDSLLYAAAVFNGGTSPEIVADIEESFRSGVGFTYEAQGPQIAAEVDGMNQAWNRTFLPDVVLPMLAGVVDSLHTGARVIDVGCGGAVTLAALAHRHPASTFHGIDPSEHAIAIATERTHDLSNVSVWVAGGEHLPSNPPYDLVLTLDILHDLPHPDAVIAAIRGAIADDGVWLVKDMKTADSFEGNQRNPLLAMMYGFSLTSCLASATSTPDGAALGTLGLTPARLEAMATTAGFTGFAVHKADDPTHLYYEIRP